MPKFTDNTGHTWSFEIDFPTLQRVYKYLHIDLVALSESEILNRIASPIFLINLTYVICKPEADEMGLTDEQFGRRCVMPLEPLVDAILGGIADFFQKLGKTRQSQVLMRAMGMTNQLSSDQVGSVLDLMEKYTQQVIAESTSGEPSGELQPEPV